MLKELLFGTLGGLGLFIFGIRLMGEGLQKCAGSEIRKILGKLTNNPIKGVLIGTGVTAIIQSSSATTVMLVGFVSAGLMTLKQAIGVTFGADIGTTITAQIIAFKLTDYALPIVGVGAFMFLFSKKNKYKSVGQAIFGFGVLFLGLSIMTSTVKPLGGSEMVRNAFITLGRNPLLGLLVGTVATVIVQSSSVTVGLTMTIASVGLLDLQAAIPILLGDNIGTTVTAWIASIGTNVVARRTAASNTVFKVLGTIIAFLLFPFYLRIVAWTSHDIARQIANAHAIFNIVNTCIFIGFIPLLVKLLNVIIPGEEPFVNRGPKHLEEKLLYTPSIAIDAATKEIVHMTRLARNMVNDTMSAFFENDRKAMVNVAQEEDAVDELQAEITNYLVSITQHELSEQESAKIPALLHAVNDIERIGDHAINLQELAERKMDQKLKFTKVSIAEIRNMFQAIDRMLGNIIDSLSSNDKDLAFDVVKLEKEVDAKTEKYKDNHLQRLKEGDCLHLSGLVFIDYLMNLEKIGDHATNVAQAILGKLSWNDDHKPYGKESKFRAENLEATPS